MVEYELVFEGVETKEELDTVVSYGCDVIQGFYFDRPLPANEFVDKYYTGSMELLMGHSTDINENEHLQYIFNDYKSGIEHGILVANLTYELAKRLKLDEREL